MKTAYSHTHSAGSGFARATRIQAKNALALAIYKHLYKSSYSCKDEAYFLHELE